ncbi:hypothetical protein [Cupriavidus basilensis]|uniref:hypothetical protein n=1 Tax=Cupriavidus basilensis TaxID=68895 RepID=UPI0020C6821B|nr:hypothetical protein [Cupriavidus basilensis]
MGAPTASPRRRAARKWQHQAEQLLVGEVAHGVHELAGGRLGDEDFLGRQLQCGLFAQFYRGRTRLGAGLRRLPGCLHFLFLALAALREQAAGSKEAHPACQAGQHATQRMTHHSHNDFSLRLIICLFFLRHCPGWPGEGGLPVASHAVQLPDIPAVGDFSVFFICGRERGYCSAGLVALSLYGVSFCTQEPYDIALLGWSLFL